MDHTTFTEPPDQPPTTRPATRCSHCPLAQTVAVDPSGVYRWIPLNGRRRGDDWNRLDHNPRR